MRTRGAVAGPRVTPRAAVTAVFFVDGALFASWVSRIPALSDRVGVDPGLLGVALLAPALAAVVTMPVVGRLLQGRSTKTFCRLGVAALIAVTPLPGLARTLPELAGALLLIGVANSTLDLAMNAQGVSVERRAATPILSTLHAAFSFGGFAGAALGSLAAGLGLAPFAHLVAAVVLFGVPGLLATTRLLATDEDADVHAPALRWRRLPRRLALLGVACFFCFVGEGGAEDWSAKLVRDDLAGSAATGALAYAAFSVAMAAGRLLADRLAIRWGSVGLLRRSGALAAAGFAAGLATGTVVGATAGLAALGLGLAGVVPTLFHAGAEEPGVSTGSALAAVASFGYLGFLAGPPLIGGLAQVTTLRTACGLLPGAGLVVLLLAPSAGAPRRRSPAAQPSLST